MSEIDPILTINGKLNLNAGIRLGGEEVKCWAPDNHGSGVFKIVLSADDCVTLGKAFTQLGKQMTKTVNSNKKLVKDGKTAYDRKLKEIYNKAQEIVKDRKANRATKKAVSKEKSASPE